MKYWYDTEFIENGETIELLSIGMVAEIVDGIQREYYAVSNDATWDHANEWVLKNVLPHLAGQPRISREQIKQDLIAFCDPERYGKPEFWGYYADYDHVALCQLFGPMVDLPKGWPMYTQDIKQLCDDLGNPKLPDQFNEHHALSDARWNKRAYEFLIKRQKYTNEWLEMIVPALRNCYEKGFLYSIIIQDPDSKSSLHFRGPTNSEITYDENELSQARLLERFARQIRLDLKKFEITP